MDKTIRIICLSLFFNMILLSCAKKELPAPYLAPSEVGNTVKPAPVVAPCDSILVMDQISASTSFEGFKSFRVSGVLYESFSYIDISLSHYSTSSRFVISLPQLRNYSGKKKYQLRDISEPYKEFATLTHRVGAYFGYMTYYKASEGEIYVDYGNNKIVVSFCNIKVSTESSSHYITGKGEVDNKSN